MSVYGGLSTSSWGHVHVVHGKRLQLTPSRHHSVRQIFPKASSSHVVTYLMKFLGMAEPMDVRFLVDDKLIHLHFIIFVLILYV